MMINVG